MGNQVDINNANRFFESSNGGERSASDKEIHGPEEKHDDGGVFSMIRMMQMQDGNEEELQKI